MFLLTWWRTVRVASTIHPSWPQHRFGRCGSAGLRAAAAVISRHVAGPPGVNVRMLVFMLSWVLLFFASCSTLPRVSTFGRLSPCQLLSLYEHSKSVSLPIRSPILPLQAEVRPQNVVDVKVSDPVRLLVARWLQEGQDGPVGLLPGVPWALWVSASISFHSDEAWAASAPAPFRSVVSPISLYYQLISIFVAAVRRASWSVAQ